MCAATKITKVKTRPEAMQLIRRHCVPLHTVEEDNSLNNRGGVKITGGSAFLWESQVGRFIVTAHHVWRELTSRMNQSPKKRHFLTYDLNGPILIRLPTIVDESEELDIAIFMAPGIKDFNPYGKAFLRTSYWPTPPARPGEIIVGCGYPGSSREFLNGRWELQMLFWAHQQCSISETGKLMRLDGQPGKGQISYSTKLKPKKIALPGISGAPLFALRDTLDWVGIVRSGCGSPHEGYSILATPSNFVAPDGRIRKNT